MDGPSIRRRVAGAACAVAAGVAGAAPDAGGAPRDAKGRFQNNYTAFEPRSLADILRWQWSAWRNGLPPPSRSATPVIAPDLAFIAANALAGSAMQPAVTWIGHASTLVQMGGLNILLDPVFAERASPVGWAGPRRVQPPGLALAQLPHIDAVLVSHNHYDHCDAATLQALNAQPGGPPLYVVPLGLKAWLAGEGVTHAVELDWWQAHTLGAVEIVLAPAQHWSARGLGDRMSTLWGGYALFAPELHLFFAGDTAYSRDFADIRERFASRQPGGGFDLALLPLGAYEPRWFMSQQHVNPEEAVLIHRDLGAQRSIGVHWGTFPLSDEALDEPPRALARAREAQGVAEDAFGVLAIGQTLKLPRRRPAP